MLDLPAVKSQYFTRFLDISYLSAIYKLGGINGDNMRYASRVVYILFGFRDNPNTLNRD
ncbi:hypothetical protein BDN67DRAFT_676220 [Paxillus ammoniavirescens]|nr:hypothetical protein BDN67DRAFT_676220 [Paxillus ammoniavirescens]